MSLYRHVWYRHVCAQAAAIAVELEEPHLTHETRVVYSYIELAHRFIGSICPNPRKHAETKCVRH